MSQTEVMLSSLSPAHPPIPPLFSSVSSLLLYSISVHLWYLKVNGAGPELDLCVAAETTS